VNGGFPEPIPVAAELSKQVFVKLSPPFPTPVAKILVVPSGATMEISRSES
jgi:hypothetical protein